MCFSYIGDIKMSLDKKIFTFDRPKVFGTCAEKIMVSSNIIRLLLGK